MNNLWPARSVCGLGELTDLALFHYTSTVMNSHRVADVCTLAGGKFDTLH